jgi:hypothetical protein
MKSVYCEVRTGSLNEAVGASYLKVNVGDQVWWLYKTIGKVSFECFNLQGFRKKIWSEWWQALHEFSLLLLSPCT